MQVIEKVKVVPEGYNGAGMDGYGRRDVNGKANAGLTLGIIGTALGAWALFGNRRSAGVLGTGAGLMGDGKKYIGEKYDMQKAHEVCSKFKDKLEDEVEVADVYVAINAQYHDYCELFEKWFGKGNFDDMIFESAINFWFDDVDFGEDKLWKYFNELK